MTNQSKALNLVAIYNPNARPEKDQHGYNMIRVDLNEKPHLFQDVFSVLIEAFPSSLFDSADYIEIRFTHDYIQLYTGRYIPETEGVANVQFIYEAAYSEVSD